MYTVNSLQGISDQLLGCPSQYCLVVKLRSYDFILQYEEDNFEKKYPFVTIVLANTIVIVKCH